MLTLVYAHVYGHEHDDGYGHGLGIGAHRMLVYGVPVPHEYSKDPQYS